MSPGYFHSNTMSTKPDRFDLLHAFAKPCNYCRQRIMWAWTNASGRVERMPLDAAPVPEGNVIAYRDEKRPRLLVCDVIGKRGDRRKLALGGWPLYQHHRLTCSQAERWARAPIAMRPQPSPRQERPADVDTDDEGELTLL